jgi:hypothetical protein
MRRRTLYLDLDPEWIEQPVQGQGRLQRAFLAGLLQVGWDSLGGGCDHWQ